MLRVTINFEVAAIPKIIQVLSLAHEQIVKTMNKSAIEGASGSIAQLLCRKMVRGVIGHVFD
jgi:hypothetical protein